MANTAAFNSSALPMLTLRNLRSGFATLKTSFAWAWLDTVCQYRRSKIGPFWETINAAVMIFGLSLVSSGIFGGNITDMIGYLGIGIIVWFAISSLTNEGCGTFIRNSSYILTANHPVDLYIGRTIFKTFITFAHHLVLYLVAILFGLLPLSWTALLAIPGICLLFLNSIWVVTILAFICARFRDVELIIRNLLQLAFLVTPVFWHHELIASNRRFIVDYNIIFHFIEIIRLPLLGQVPSANTYLIVIATLAFGSLIAAFVYRAMRRQLAFCL